jgi:short-subunit dehydrogenase
MSSDAALEEKESIGRGGKVGKRALVTGASAGLGAEFARQLAAKGYDLVLVARRRARMEELASQLKEAWQSEVEIIESDLSKPEGVAVVEERLRRGDIDLLVNNAGFGTAGEFVNLPIDRELEEIDVNVKALTRLSHAALAAMKERGKGRIVNVASTAAFQPVPYMSTYAATKAYVLSFSEALHEEAKAYGVIVTCLCPGPVRTEFQEVAGVDSERMQMVWTSPEHVVRVALEAARRGRASTITGVLNRVGVGLTRVVPRVAARKVAGAMFKRATTGSPTSTRKEERCG